MSKPTEEVEEEAFKKFQDVKIFGRNISEIPCFRNSFLFGISVGVVTGLLTFMFTSKARLSSHFAFGSLWLGIFGYWIPCRYRYESNQLTAEEWKRIGREVAKLKVQKYESEELSSSNSNDETKEK